MPDLTEFLLARLAEDLKRADAALRRDPLNGWRAVADLSGKRRVVADYAELDKNGGAHVGYMCTAEHDLYRVLLLLAQPYADHADFRSEWAI